MSDPAQSHVTLPLEEWRQYRKIELAAHECIGRMEFVANQNLKKKELRVALDRVREILQAALVSKKCRGVQ